MANTWIIAVEPEIAALVEHGRAVGGSVVAVTVGGTPVAGVDRVVDVPPPPGAPPPPPPPARRYRLEPRRYATPMTRATKDSGTPMKGSGISSTAPAAAAVRAPTAGERPRPPSVFSRWSTATLLSLVFSARVGSPLTMMEPGPAERQGNA